jgi:hypothetical protein
VFLRFSEFVRDRASSFREQPNLKADFSGAIRVEAPFESDDVLGELTSEERPVVHRHDPSEEGEMFHGILDDDTLVTSRVEEPVCGIDDEPVVCDVISDPKMSFVLVDALAVQFDSALHVRLDHHEPHLEIHALRETAEADIEFLIDEAKCEEGDDGEHEGTNSAKHHEIPHDEIVDVLDWFGPDSFQEKGLEKKDDDASWEEEHFYKINFLAILNFLK